MKQTYVTTSWDDGHKQDLRLAALLKKYGLPGTFYVSPQDREFSAAELLTASEVQTLAADFEIGAHTLTHPRLTTVDNATVWQEIIDSKQALQTILQKPVESFCYPGGAFYPSHLRLIRQAGFKLARTVERFSLHPTNPLALPTTVHAYRHWSDIWRIATVSRFVPHRFVHYLLNWDALAIALFEKANREGGIFHLWGHSWEVDRQGDWPRLEKVLAHIAGRKDVTYVSNGELVRHVKPKLLVVASYFPPKTGGLERYAYEMAKAAERAGYEVVVITSADIPKAEVTTQDNLRIYRLPIQYKLSNTPINLGWYWHIKRIIRREAPDILNVHIPVPYMGDLAVLAAGKRMPVIINYHAGSMKKQRRLLDGLIGAYERLVLPAILARATQIICPSEGARAGFLSNYRCSPVVITPGVDVELFTRRASQAAEQRILFVGSFVNSNKGLSYLREAVLQLPEVSLHVVGEGPQVAWERTTYHGALRGKALVEQFHQASVLVLPSTRPEGLPTVLLEAMACGVPVVGSDVGGITSIIEHENNGLLAPPSDATGLAAAIKRILTDRHLAARLSDAGYQKVTSEYTWLQKTDQYLKQLELVLYGPDDANPNPTAALEEPESDR